MKPLNFRSSAQSTRPALTYLFCGCTGGYIVISHPLGRKWLEEYMHKKDPVMVPHLLPDQAQLEALISDLPLRLHSYVDEEHLYIATLQVKRLRICCMCMHHLVCCWSCCAWCLVMPTVSA